MFLLPFSAFFSDTYFTYLEHRAFTLRCTELCFRRLCNFDLPNKQRFSLQRHKSTRIRLVPNSWDSYAGFLWHRAFPSGTQSFLPRCTELFPSCAQSFVLAAFATLVCQRNCVFLCKGTKLKNSACALCRFFVAQSFAFASGNSCFNNSRVQKHKNSACAEFLDSLL